MVEQWQEAGHAHYTHTAIRIWLKTTILPCLNELRSTHVEVPLRRSVYHTLGF